MPEKKNSSGRMQNYDEKTGRYAKANVIDENINVDYVTAMVIFYFKERIKHISVGDFGLNSGRYKSGGHGQANITLLDKMGIKYEINMEYNNGVRVGNILGCLNPHFNSGNNHSWFPKSWDDDKITEAISYGLRIYNGEYLEREVYEFVYEGVKITIVFGKNKSVSTAFPNKEQEGGLVYDNR